MRGVLPFQPLHKRCVQRKEWRRQAGGSRRASLGSQTLFIAFGLPVPARQRTSFNRGGRGGPQGKQNKEPVSRGDAGTQRKTAEPLRTQPAPAEAGGGHGDGRPQINADEHGSLLRTQRWFPHTATPHPQTCAQGRFRGVDATHVPAAGPASQPRRVHFRRSPEAVYGPNPFCRRPIGGFLRKESRFEASPA